jgi:hypothetical protein
MVGKDDVHLNLLQIKVKGPRWVVRIFGSDPYVDAPLTDQLVGLQGCVFFGHGALVELHNSISVAY